MASSNYDGSINIDTRIDTDAFITGIATINESLKRLEISLNNLTVTIRKAFDLPDISTEQINNINDSIREATGEIQEDGERISESLSRDIENNAAAEIQKEAEAIRMAADEIQEDGERISEALEPNYETNHNMPDVESDMVSAEINMPTQEIKEYDEALRKALTDLEELESRGFAWGDEEYEKAYRHMQDILNAQREYLDNSGQININDYNGRNVTEEIENSVDMSEINERLRKIRELSAELKSMEKAGKYFGDDDYNKTYTELIKLQEEVKNYRTQLDAAAANEMALNAPFQNLNNDILAAQSNLAMLSAKGLGFGNEEFDQAYQEYVRANAALRDYRRELEETATANEKENIQASRFSRILSGVGNGLNKFGQVAAKGFKKMWSAARKAFNAITGGSKRSKKGLDLMNTGIGKVIKKISRMAKTILFFRIFRTGLTNLRTYLGNLLKSNEQFVNSLAQVKGNLKTAFMPVYDAIMPAINVMMAGLVKLSGYLVQITTTIFGKSIKSMQSEAKALDKVGKSAKEANKQLGAYDNLNVITKASDSSGSSGADDIGSIYGDIKPSNWLANLMDEFKNGNYEEAGREISRKINGALAGIDWSEITETAGRIGTNIAGFLNGGIDELDFNQIGATLGNGLNTAITFALGFVETFDWSRFGEQVSNGINGTFNTVDWKKAATLITRGLDGITRTLRKTVQGTDWENIGISLGTLINGLINVDWGEVGGLLSDTFIGLLELIIGLLEEVDWEQLGADIVDFITGIDWLTLLQKLGDAIILAWKACIKLQIGYFKEIALFVWTSIKNSFGNVGTWFKEKFNEAIQGIYSVFSSIGTWFSDRWSDICNIFQSVGNWFSDKFSDAWNRIKSVFSIENVKNYFREVWNGIKNVFGNVSGWFKEKFTNAWESVKNVFSKGGKIFSGIKDGIVDAFKKIVNALITGINKVIATPFNKINSMLNSIRGINILGAKPFKNLWDKNPIGVPKIPYLASGAVIPPNNKFLAVLGDQKSGMNIEAPASLIKQMAKEAIEEVGLGSNSDVTVNVYLQGEAEGLFKAVKTECIKEQKRKPGKPVWEG